MFLCNVYAFISFMLSTLTTIVTDYIEIFELASVCEAIFYALISHNRIDMY